MTKDEWYKQLFERLDKSKFRSSFHLKQKLRAITIINFSGLNDMQTAYQWTGHWNYSKNNIA